MTEEARKILNLLKYLGEKNVGKCGTPLHINMFENLYLEDIFVKAADLIESLSEQLEQVTMERDAAFAKLESIDRGKGCATCSLYKPRHYTLTCKTCKKCDKWQWRGVEVE